MQDKTAEEIKSEVLKAAKERSKAKAKLFPDKTNREKLSPSASDSDIKSEDDFVTSSSIQINVLEQKSNVSTQSGDSVEKDCLKTDYDTLDESASRHESDSVSQQDIEEDTFSGVSKNATLLSENFGINSNFMDSDTEFSQQKQENEDSDRCVNVVVSTDSFTDVSLSVIEQDSGNTDSYCVNDTLPYKCDNEGSLIDDKQPDGKDTVTDKTTIEHEDMSKVKVAEETGSEPKISESDPIEIPVDELVDISSSDPEILDCDKVSSDEDLVKVSQQEAAESQAQSVQGREDSEITITNTSTKDEPHVETEESSTVLEEIANISEHSESSSTQKEILEPAEHSVSESVTPIKSSDSESSVNRLDTSADTCTSEDTVIEQVVNPDGSDDTIGFRMANVSLERPEESNLDKPYVMTSELEESDERLEDTHSLSDDDSGKFDEKVDVSPAHSFVKCMLEDVFDEGKQDDSSESHSAEKSDGSRSINSNHESGDEIDTTTSSDIEIISLPTPNGDNRMVRLMSFDLEHNL